MSAEKVLVFDASPLNHFARAGELDVLGRLVGSHRCVITRAVRHELEQGAARHQAIGNALELPWIDVVPCDGLDELYVFAEYLRRLGSPTRNAGEASALAWAEVHGAAVYLDDQVGCNVGRKRGVEVVRTLRLIVSAHRQELLSEARCQQLVNSLADADARFPQAARSDLFGWARAQGLLHGVP